MPRERHWTAEGANAFAHKLAFDFIAQIENRLQELELSQNELARKLGVSEGAVSQMLNNPQNLTLKTIAKYACALGIKTAIVAYDDGDPSNERGLINSGIFGTCWERAGKPRDIWSLKARQPQKSAATGFDDKTGIQPFEKPDSLALNAAQLNPVKKLPKKSA